MATPLAIEAPADRAFAPPALAVRKTAGVAMAGRPPIPRGVITWPDPPPAGAGDPAVAIDGPPPFVPWNGAEARPVPHRSRLDSLLFGAVVLAFLGAVSLAAVDAFRSSRAMIAGDVDPALLGRMPVVETWLLSMEPVIDTAARAPASNGHRGG